MSRVLRLLRVTFVSGLLASSLLLSADSVLANHNEHHQTGPQQIADGPCNEGTQNARENLDGSPAKDAVPHYHEFPPDYEQHCYHANPNYPPQQP